MSSRQESEDIVRVIDKYIEFKKENIHTMIPGKVQKYYGHTDRRADIVPLVKSINHMGQVVALPVILDVQIQFPSNIIHPVIENDFVYVLFSEYDLSAFYAGNGSSPSTPAIRSKFSLGSSIAIPGLFPESKVPVVGDNEKDMFIQFKDKTIQLAAENDEITISNKSGAVFLMNATEVLINGKLKIPV